MKMKRMFGKKKTKANNSAMQDSKVMATIEESAVDNDVQNNPKSNSKKKQRNRKKRKSKQKNSAKIVEDQSPGDPTVAYHDQGGTRVTIRQRHGHMGDQMSTNNPKRNHKLEERRIPGSESSSRTASSASSTSQSLSTRRPWSLIDSTRGQSLSDLTDEVEFSREFTNSPSDHYNLTAPTICTLPRGSALDEDFGKSNRSRTFALDFSFFRRFKRSSLSHAVANNKRLSASQIILPQPTKERESFSIKGLKKNRKSKKQSNEDEFSKMSSSQPCLNSLESGGRKSLLSCSESLLPVQESDLEDTTSPSDSPKKTDPSSSETSSSRASINTVIGAMDRQAVKPTHSTPLHALANSEMARSSDVHDGINLETLRCKKCQKLRTGHRRSVCYCVSMDNHPEKSILHNREWTAQSQTELNSVTPPGTAAKCRTTSSLIDFNQCPQSISNTQFGGSMKNVRDTLEETSATSSKTETCAAKKLQFQVLSPKGSAPYASSPQVNISEVAKVSKKRVKAASVKIRFAEDKAKLRTFSPSRPLKVVQSTSDISFVDSTVKAAIGYPGVVMRRNKNRSLKNTADSLMVKSSSSCGLMSREDRAKQVLSLNVEDLPTYERMRDSEKWRLSLAPKDRGSTEATTYGNWSRGDSLARQCAFHYTSAGDLSNVRCLTGHSIEDISNMDDDEFLNFYLSASPTNTATARDVNRMQQQEAGFKRVKNLRKSVASFANLISPGKPGKKVQRSSSFKESSGPAVKSNRPPGPNNGSGGGGSGVLASYCPPGKRGKSKTKNRRSQLWCETFDRSGLADVELKRQEAIYELYQGERIMVDDLKMAKQTYRDSMVTLKMLTEKEVNRIFGKLDCLLPLHEDLLARLEKTRTKDGKTDGVAEVFIEWFPTLSPYNEYCANQADAKETLDNVVSREARVRDFLQRCLESPFSRKLDLWSYLDLPRSRLVKYPLLLKAIHKATPPGHRDASLLRQAIDVISNIIARVDELTGERQAKFVKSKLEYLDDKKRYPEVEISKKIICSGQLKSNRGPKLQVFLFDHALVLTRNATRGEKLTYQIYRHPVPLKTLIVETEEGGKLNGSLRGGLLSSDKAKYSFRVKSEERNVSYTLIATDEHDKKQWVNAIQEAINDCGAGSHECASIRATVPHRGRGSSQKVKSSESKVDLASVKRTSSMKSDSGASSPWYRSRSMTLTPGRRSGKEKKESGDLPDKSKLSPAPSRQRRHSKPSVFDSLPEPDFLLRKNSLDDKSDWERSRSLTSSPIAFLTHLPKKRLPRNGSGLGRSESCYTKPPKGRVASFVRQYSGRAPPRSPVISSTRSIPDLPSYERQRSNSDHSINVEMVRNRLALVGSRSSSTLSESVTEENFPSSSSAKDTESTSSASPLDSHTSITSPPRRHSSKTCPCNASDAYDTDTSTPIHTSTSSPNILQSVRIPTISWAPPSDDDTSRSPNKRVSSCSSASSLADLPPGMDDIESILDNASQDHCRGDGFHNDDVNSSNNTSCDVKATMGDLLNRVCKTTTPQPRVVAPLPHLTVTCSDHYITITSDVGLPWTGNDVEMSI